jgi:hypothetical protein
VVAYQMAIVLAGVSAYFSVTGLAELFPGLAVQVLVLGVALEGAKLTLVGWLSAHWRITGWQLRMAVVVLIAGLATFNASGVFARLIEGHLGVLAERTSSVSSRVGALDAKIAAQAGIVGRIDARIDEIGAAIARMTSTGKAKAALRSTEEQRHAREALEVERQKAAAVLVAMKGERAGLDGEEQRVRASVGPALYLAMMLGTDPESIIRWLALMAVLLADPSSIVLMIAASRRE